MNWQRPSVMQNAITLILISISCGLVKSKIIDTGGEIVSMNYPLPYERNSFEVRYIRTSPKMVVFLYFAEIFFGYEANDYLIIFDGPDCLSKRVAAVYKNTGQGFLSSGPKMTLLYTSDNQDEYAGFRALYNFIPQSTAHPKEYLTNTSLDNLLINCGEANNDGAGRIDFSAGNMRNGLCIWRVRVQPWARLAMYIKVHYSMNHRNKFFVLDGDNCTAHKIYTYKRGEDGKFVTASKNTAIVVLKTKKKTGFFGGLSIAFGEVGRHDLRSIMNLPKQTFRMNAQTLLPHSSTKNELTTELSSNTISSSTAAIPGTEQQVSLISLREMVAEVLSKKNSVGSWNFLSNGLMFAMLTVIQLIA